MGFGSKDYELVSAGTRLCYATGRRNREKGSSMKVVIVGGVAGGATAAARLRRLDEEAEIVVFERSGYISYANCGLPYYIGGTIADKSALTLQTPESFRARFNVDMRTRHEVEAVDAKRHVVTVRNLDTGEVFEEPYDKLILSPGARPTQPKLPGTGLDRLFTLRTVEDTFAMKDFINGVSCIPAGEKGWGIRNITRFGLPGEVSIKLHCRTVRLYS